MNQRIALKENLVLVDYDLKGDLILEPDLLKQYTFIILNGFSREELIELYKRAKVVLDLHFNGPERTVWEGVMFDALPIVAEQGNGGDNVDIPIPHRFKIDARHHGKRQIAHMSATLRHLLENYDQILSQGHFETFRRKVTRMPNTFAEAVSQTFSSASLHFVLGREDESGDDFRLDYTNWDSVLQFENGQVMSLLSILYVMPLARVTLYHRHPLAFVRRWDKLWRELSALGLSDALGGKHFHTVRVVKTGNARIESDPKGGDLQVFIPGPGNVLLLPVLNGSRSTLLKIGVCLQSEGVDNKLADIDLGSKTRFHVVLSRRSSLGATECETSL